MYNNAVDKKASSLISLCVRAGLAASGEAKCEKTMQQGKAKLVIISCDASDNTKKKFTNKAFFYKVPVVFYGSKQELGKLTGAGVTSSICVTDKNLSERVTSAIQAIHNPQEPQGGKFIVEDSNI